jgi:hypothetical protein
VSVEKEALVLSTQSLLSLRCPDEAQFFWNWDADQQRDLDVSLTDRPVSGLARARQQSRNN